MAEITVPELSESVVEATVAEWLKQEGDNIEIGDVLVVLETDKVQLEVAAESAGILKQIVAGEDEDVVAHQVLGIVEDGDGASSSASTTAEESASSTSTPEPAQASSTPEPATSSSEVKATPVARNMAQAHGIDLSKVPARDGKIDKTDVQAYIDGQSQPAPASKPASPSAPKPAPSAPAPQRELDARETREKLSRRRRTIAKRLVEAQATAAMLTTFNEVDMSAINDVRGRRKAAFKEKYGTSLSINAFFVKAVIGALKAFPRLNAEIDGDYVINKDYYDIGIAVGAEEGLVVPVIRDADRKSFAEIGRTISQYGKQVQDGTLPLEALRGGTFTITNGGIFGSMMSTPILNYPQVGILGLHGIKERPVVVDGEIVIRPWMYMALTYDHRIVDGRDAVQFLVKVKDLIEDPESLLLEG